MPADLLDELRFVGGGGGGGDLVAAVAAQNLAVEHCAADTSGGGQEDGKRPASSRQACGKGASGDRKGVADGARVDRDAPRRRRRAALPGASGPSRLRLP